MKHLISYFVLYQMLALIHRFFRRIDLFSTLPVLRCKQQPKIQSVALGFISFLILGFFLAMIIKQLVDLSNQQSSLINTSTSLETNSQNKNLENIMVGISFKTNGIQTNILQYFALEAMTFKETFQIYQQQTQQKRERKNLVRCRAEQWNLTNSSFNLPEGPKLYSYCLQNLQKATVQGSGRFLKILIKRCNNGTNQIQCKSKAEIDSFYEGIINQSKHFQINVTILEPYAEVSNKDPLKYKPQQKIFTTTKTVGTKVSQYFDFFTIKTDRSVWPVHQDPSQKTGYSSAQKYTTAKKFDKLQESIFEIQFLLTNNNIIYNQGFKKVDEIMSYFGGLVGLIVLFLVFFFKTYNDYRYELYVAENSFNWDSDGNKIRVHWFNIFRYFRYKFYYLFKLVFGCTWNSQKNQQIQETLIEARHLLDVQKLCRRIDVLEKIIWKTNNNNILLVSTLKQSETIDDVQNKRLTLEYYQQIINLKAAATVEDALNESINSFKYLTKLVKKIRKGKRISFLSSSSKQAPYQENEKHQQSKREETIKNELVEFLNLGELSQICTAISHYTLIDQQASLIQLDEQYEEVEQQIVQSFIQLETTLKKSVMMKIPLKIIFRMKNRAKQMAQQKRVKQKQSKSEQIFNKKLQQSQDRLFSNTKLQG